MAKSKGVLKDIVKRCETGEGTPIPEEAYDSDGDLDSSKIFCSICHLGESTDVRRKPLFSAASWGPPSCPSIFISSKATTAMGH